MGKNPATQVSMPVNVEAVFERYPADARNYLFQIRELIFQTADETRDIGSLTETLKWGEPAYLTEQTKNGTTVRLSWKEKHAGSVSLFVSCQTTLVEDWRTHYSDALDFIGNREIRLPIKKRLPAKTLKHCIAMALTYHSRKKSQ